MDLLLHAESSMASTLVPHVPHCHQVKSNGSSYHQCHHIGYHNPFETMSKNFRSNLVVETNLHPRPHDVPILSKLQLRGHNRQQPSLFQPSQNEYPSIQTDAGPPGTIDIMTNPIGQAELHTAAGLHCHHHHLEECWPMNKLVRQFSTALSSDDDATMPEVIDKRFQGDDASALPMMKTGTCPLERPQPLVVKACMTKTSKGLLTIPHPDPLLLDRRNDIRMESISSLPSFLANASDESDWGDGEADWMETDDGPTNTNAFMWEYFCKTWARNIDDCDQNDKENSEPQLPTSDDNKVATACILPSVPRISSHGVKVWLNFGKIPIAAIEHRMYTEHSNQEEFAPQLQLQQQHAPSSIAMAGYVPPVPRMSAEGVRLWLNHGKPNHEPLRLSSHWRWYEK